MWARIATSQFPDRRSFQVSEIKRPDDKTGGTTCAVPPVRMTLLGQLAQPVQLRCFETAAVILNIEIWSPPITAPSLSSGLIMRLSLESCRLLALMCSHTLEVTCARVIGPLPTTLSSSGDRFTGLFSALFLAAIQ